MTDILNFPRRLKDSRQEFLRGEDETLQFDADCKVASLTMPDSDETKMAGYGVGYGAPKNRYWSNQEIASLFRVKRLLDAAGIVCDVDHDCTDEGDPWFVFCDAAEEVFIHLCRIDGKYLLDSPNISTPLTGWDFRELIEGFIQRNGPRQSHPAASTETGSGQRVVRFERNGKVFMHPATMLAALIWTLLLESEDLVMLLPKSTDAQTDAVNDLAGQGSSTKADPQSTLQEQDATQTADTSIGQPDSPDSAPKLQFPREMSFHDDTKLGYNNYALGLSAIAISAGFMSDHPLWDIPQVELSGMLDVLLDNLYSDFSDSAETTLTGLDKNTFDFLTFVRAIMANVTDPKNESDNVANAQDAMTEHLKIDSQIFQIHLDNISADISPEVIFKDTGEPEQALPRKSMTIDAHVADAPFITQDETLSPESLLSRLSLTGNNIVLKDDLRIMTIQNEDLHATFNVTDKIWDKTNSLLAKANDNSALPVAYDDRIELIEKPKTGQQDYDDDAQAILQFLMSKSTNMEIIATRNEIMVLDASIISADANDIFVFSWTLENGDMITTMGLRSQLESDELYMYG